VRWLRIVPYGSGCQVYNVQPLRLRENKDAKSFVVVVVVEKY
jgi:hypothetical protein